MVGSYSCVHWLRTSRRVIDDFPIWSMGSANGSRKRLRWPTATTITTDSNWHLVRHSWRNNWEIVHVYRVICQATRWLYLWLYSVEKLSLRRLRSWSAERMQFQHFPIQFSTALLSVYQQKVKFGRRLSQGSRIYGFIVRNAGNKGKGNASVSRPNWHVLYNPMEREKPNKGSEHNWRNWTDRYLRQTRKMQDFLWAKKRGMRKEKDRSSGIPSLQVSDNTWLPVRSSRQGGYWFGCNYYDPNVLRTWIGKMRFMPKDPWSDTYNVILLFFALTHGFGHQKESRGTVVGRILC